MRIQAYLARSGKWSRRSADVVVAAGRVTINGAPAQVGSQVTEGDSVVVDGDLITHEQTVTYALNKPTRYVCSTVQQGSEPIVTSLVPAHPHVYPVGRLDSVSEGLLILTNDGQLAQQLLHPSYGHRKTYRVYIVDDGATVPVTKLAQAFHEGIAVEGRPLHGQLLIERDEHSRAIVSLTIGEGRYHIIRRAFGVLGWSISRLIRVRIGSYELGTLPVGSYIALTSDDIAKLLHAER